MDGKKEANNREGNLVKEIASQYGGTILRYGILPAFILISFYTTPSQFALLMDIVFWSVLCIGGAALFSLVMWLVRD